MPLFFGDTLVNNPIIRNMPKNDRDWVRFLEALNETTFGTFTPSSYSGFSSDPSGEISYFFFGPMAIMWRSAALTGTSDASTFILNGIPKEIRPTATFVIVPCVLTDNSQIVMGSASVHANGQIIFNISQVDSGGATDRIFTAAASWTTSNDKGMAAGWTVLYPLK